jgi:tripartite-type tricarboxylate transporter receptor subunit TctC
LTFNTIPYSGGPKVGPALVSKEVDCYFGSISGYFRMENTRCLAVGTPERYPLALDIPTLKEKGINVVSVKRRGFAGPPGFPVQAVKYLEGVIATINKNPAYIEDMKKLGTMPVFQTAAEFGASIQDEKKNSEEMLKKLNYTQ